MFGLMTSGLFFISAKPCEQNGVTRECMELGPIYELHAFAKVTKLEHWQAAGNAITLHLQLQQSPSLPQGPWYCTSM